MNARHPLSDPAPRRTPAPLVLGALLATGVLAGSLLRRASWRQLGLLAATGAGVWHFINRPRPAQSQQRADDFIAPEPLALPQWSDAPSFWVPFQQSVIRDLPVISPVIDIAEVEALSPAPILPLMSVWESLATNPPSTLSPIEQSSVTVSTDATPPVPEGRPLESALALELQPAALFDETVVENIESNTAADAECIESAPAAEESDIPVPCLEISPPVFVPLSEPVPVGEFMVEQPPVPMLFPELDTRPPEPVLAKNDAWLLGLEPLPVIHPEPVWPQRYSHLAEGAVLPDEIEIEISAPVLAEAAAGGLDPELSSPSRSLLNPLFAVRADSEFDHVADSGPIVPQPAMPPSIPVPVAVHSPAPVAPSVPSPISIKPIQPMLGAMASMPRSITWLDGELSRKPHVAARSEPAELVGATAQPAHRRIIPRAPTTSEGISANKKAWLNWWK